MKFEPHTLLAERYRILDLLAQGGMGVVYRAHDERLDRVVAVKTVRTADPHLVAHLRREAQLLARLTHPNVVKLYDVGEHEGQPYLVTQLVDGIPLRRMLGRMSTRRIAWVAEQIAHGLAAAHALGIVHRDLKPSNVLVGDGTVRLLDFGIARHVDERVVTRPETILGTASYISPEQLRGQQAGPRADVYALGLVLLECFSGRAAYPGTFADTVAARMVEPPVLPEALPPAWHELLTAMTAADPDRRPPATVVAAAVRALGRARPGDAPMALPAFDSDETVVDERRIRVLPTAAPMQRAAAGATAGPGDDATGIAASPVGATDGVVLLPPPAVPSPPASADGTGDPGRRRRWLIGGAVGVPAAAAIPGAAVVGFVLVLVLGSIITPDGVADPGPRGLRTEAADESPSVATLPVTEAVPTVPPGTEPAVTTTVSTTSTSAATRVTSTTTEPPDTSRLTTRRSASTSVSTTTTRKKTTTTESTRRRWSWRRRR